MAFRSLTNNKREPFTYLVASGDQALGTASDPLIDTTNNNTNLLANQLAFVDASGMGSNTYLDITDATPTIAESPVIFIAQGTVDGQNFSTRNQAYPLYPRPYERSGDIKGINQIYATKQLYTAPTNSVWVIGDTGALATGGIIAYDNTEYALTIAYRGYVEDELYSSEASQFVAPSYTTPNYTALGTTAPLDHLVKNLCASINRHSRLLTVNRDKYGANEPIVAFALDLSGGVGTSVAGLAAGGATVPVITTTTGVKSITLSAEEVTNIKAALPTGCSIININTATAGAAAEADAMAIWTLDRELVFDDKVRHVKTRVDLGLRRGFDSNQVYHVQTSFAFEGENNTRALDLHYRATHGQSKYNLDHTLDPVVEFPSPIVATTNYVVYNIRHVQSNQVDTFNVVDSPQVTRVLIPTGDSTTIAAFDTALDSWLTSAGSDLVTI